MEPGEWTKERILAEMMGPSSHADLAHAYETWSCGQRFAGLARGLAPTMCLEGEMTHSRKGEVERAVMESSAT